MCPRSGPRAVLCSIKKTGLLTPGRSRPRDICTRGFRFYANFPRFGRVSDTEREPRASCMHLVHGALCRAHLAGGLLYELFGRVCAVTSIVDRSVRSIEPVDGRYGGCWRRSSPKPPSQRPRRRLNSPSSTPGTRARRLRARGVAGNAILGAFRCRSPPSHPAFTPDNPLQTAPFLIARYDGARAKPTHARALRRRRRSLARSIARARCGS